MTKKQLIEDVRKVLMDEIERDFDTWVDTLEAGKVYDTVDDRPTFGPYYINLYNIVPSESFFDRQNFMLSYDLPDSTS